MVSSVCFCVFLLMTVWAGFRADDTCVCPNKDHCKRKNTWATGEKQVVITTELASNYTDWSWNSLTMVLLLNKSLENQSDLMCYTHSQGKQYGFFLDVPSTYNTSELSSFINETVQDVEDLHADVVALDFMHLLGNCGDTRNNAQSILQSVELVISGIKSQASNTVILCVLPWKPPCYDSDCEITPKMAAICDGLILNLDSFSTYCDESCTAKPMVSYNKLMLALEDYISMGFNESQMLISIAWHGYRYTCSSSDVLDSSVRIPICHLKTVSDGNKEVCSYKESRSKVNLGQLINDHPELAHPNKTYSVADQAAWFTSKNADNNSELVWYEDVLSLQKKYHVVQMFALRGLVVYTAEDLSHTHFHTSGHHGMDEFMWSWLVHEVLMENNEPADPITQINYTGTMVGVAVGMFLFGVLAGTIIGCIVFRHGCVCNRRYRQFGADARAQEYHDDL